MKSALLYMQIGTLALLIASLVFSLVANYYTVKTFRAMNARITRLERIAGIHGTDEGTKVRMWQGQR